MGCTRQGVSTSLHPSAARFHKIHIIVFLSNLFPQLEKSRDEECIRILDGNVIDECGHVRAALKWFQYLCDLDHRDAMETYHE